MVKGKLRKGNLWFVVQQVLPGLWNFPRSRKPSDGNDAPEQFWCSFPPGAGSGAYCDGRYGGPERLKSLADL
jgi:hypothetical protein